MMQEIVVDPVLTSSTVHNVLVLVEIHTVMLQIPWSVMDTVREPATTPLKLDKIDMRAFLGKQRLLSRQGQEQNLFSHIKTSKRV